MAWNRLMDVRLTSAVLLAMVFASCVAELPEELRRSERVRRDAVDNCGKPDPPKNGRIIQCSWNSKLMSCIAICAEGWQFSSKQSSVELKCYNNGIWTPFAKFPDCKPVCERQCENGGECYGNNRCSCKREFRGPYCEYPISNCAISNTKAFVNGNCTHTSTITRCDLSCPEGSAFDLDSPRQVTCSLDGVWTPSDLPFCKQRNNCKRPSPPRAGRIRCSSNGQRMTCVAKCLRGWEFPTRQSVIQLQCNNYNGKWNPSNKFPDCENMSYRG